MKRDKTCIQCLKRKPVTWNFDLHPSCKDGWNPRCKSCLKINNHRRYKAHKAGRFYTARFDNPV